MDYWSSLDTAADLSLIYGARQRADTLAATRDLLAAQRSAAAVERQRLAVEESRRQAEADDRGAQQQALERVTAARKLLFKFEQNLDLLERGSDAIPEKLVILGIIEENARRLENVFSELGDIRALGNVAARTADITNSLLVKGAISASPSETLKQALPELESIFKAARGSLGDRLFVHPKYQSEVITIRSAIEQWNQRMDKLSSEFGARWDKLRNDLAAIGLRLEGGSIIDTEYFLRRKEALLGKAARLEAVRNELLDLWQKTRAEDRGSFEHFQQEETRLTFNSLPSQVDLNRKTLLATGQDGAIDPFEIDEKITYVRSLRGNFDAELEALRTRIPEICAYSQTGAPNKNISFFVTSSETEEEQYPHAACLDFYELLGREGPVYNDICAELSDIEDHLQRLLEQYTEQCRQMEQVNALMQAGNVFSAKRMLDDMKRIFAVVPYHAYDEAIEQHSRLLKQAEDLERRVKRVTSSIFGVTRGKKEKMWVEYSQLSRTAEGLAECELKAELLRRLAAIKSIAGFS